MKIGRLGERALIKRIAELTKAGERADGTVGIGDDAALTEPREGKWLATTKDMLVEGVHFLLPHISPRDLGYKALAVNLSDLAAMGAVPRHVFVALALPKETDADWILEFYHGLHELAAPHGVTVAGGDTVGSPGPLVVSITAQGEVAREKALLRSGAAPGDIICVTGPLGASAAGLQCVLHNAPCPRDIREEALRAHYRPVPRLAEGAFFAESGVVTAAMDLSDGLAKDLLEICEQSGCGALLLAEQIPVHAAAAAVARVCGMDPLAMALHGGEDYELLATVNPGHFGALAAAYAARFGRPLVAVGETSGSAGIEMTTNDGKREKLTFTGFQHF